MKTQSKSKARQYGITLVELMIALAISSILMLGISTIYVGNKRGYNIGTNLARQQENSRFSVELLIHDLRMAGYPKAFVLNPIISATTTDGGGAANDAITVQYESKTDCLGQNTPACADDASKQCAVNQYYIKNNDLYCTGNGSASEDVIAQDVTNMQILYGIDTDTSEDGNANKYVSWDHVSTKERAHIVSVRFALLSRTPNDVRKVDVTKSYSLLGQTVTPADKKRIYRMYSNTVLLRNRMQ